MVNSIDSCLITQENIKNSGDYLIKDCQDCGTQYYINKKGKSPYCCKCRYLKRRAAEKVRKAPKSLPSFPRTMPFQTRQEADTYLKGDGVSKIQCLECGNWYGSLGVHLLNRHGCDVREYKVKYGLAFSGGGLVGEFRRQSASEVGKQRIASAEGKEHFERIHKKAIESMKAGRGQKQRNWTPYLKKEASERLNANSPIQTEGHLPCQHPCVDCGVEVTTTTRFAIANSCRVMCEECKLKRAKQQYRGNNERFYKKLKQDPKRHREYLDKAKQRYHNKKEKGDG